MVKNLFLTSSFLKCFTSDLFTSQVLAPPLEILSTRLISLRLWLLNSDHFKGALFDSRRSHDARDCSNTFKQRSHYPSVNISIEHSEHKKLPLKQATVACVVLFSFPFHALFSPLFLHSEAPLKRKDISPSTEAITTTTTSVS